MTVKEFYSKIGGDYDNALLRLPNDTLIIRFIKLFASDKSYSELTEAVQNGDINASFQAAHKLKGVAANMAFTELYHAVSALNEQLRPLTTPADPILMQKVTSSYNQILSEIPLIRNS